MRLRTTSAVVVGVILASTFFAACKDRSPHNTNNNGCPPRPCENDGLCGEGENCLWCADCCAQCDLQDGRRYEFIATSLFFPETMDDVRNIGVDLDGDGTIDNQMGYWPIFLPIPYNEMFTESIQRGRFIVLLRLLANHLSEDGTVAIQLLPGDHDPTHDATEDNLTGSGHALFHPEADQTAHLCGNLDGGYLTSSPGTIVIPYPHIDPNTGRAFLLPVVAARLLSSHTVNENELSEAIVGGAITYETWQDTLIPAIVAHFNAGADADPDGWAASYAQGWYDAACDSQVEGCQDVVNGEGECAPWEGPNDPNPLLTTTEFRCNAVVDAGFHLDIDLDGDCLPDAISVGFKISAIRVTIGN